MFLCIYTCFIIFNVIRKVCKLSVYGFVVMLIFNFVFKHLLLCSLAFSFASWFMLLHLMSTDSLINAICWSSHIYSASVIIVPFMPVFVHLV